MLAAVLVEQPDGLQQLARPAGQGTRRRHGGSGLGLTISKLDDTSTAGTGIVATTYANLGANGILASRDWDMVVTDESHSLSRNQAGDMTAALRNLRAITNRPADLWHKFHLQQADRWARIEALKDGSPERAAAITKFYEDRAAFIEAEGKKPRGKSKPLAGKMLAFLDYFAAVSLRL